ncbi:Patatin-like phospholipase domain-containing protein MGG_12849 [Hondaea fermentalgiana]|uniref:Patatin-like phospholipase domain-containing protein MGG_12849 n=1 Tax=Hondaea fermentalgiana TaxID=2315210 RepID=A0A2R5GVI9_9STRA|nr:Patatin-like phospholipase domain-containing protein MGG_12849 [Hondaea fermentalgiana]|eukprot:GBG31934.1 Patatin-like phospholipase domain-containing protein MGG_12849 [Hondaea fermentalgiana]
MSASRLRAAHEGAEASQQRRSVALTLASDKVEDDRREILRFARKMNGQQHEKAKVGGIVTLEVTPAGLASKSSGEDSPAWTPRFRPSEVNAGKPTRRKCLRSLTSGEVRWLPAEDALQYDVEEIYEWAREEIMCAFEADVDVLIMDEVGPEVIHGETFDSALRACLWKADEERVKTKFLLIVDPSVISQLPQLYNIDPVEMDGFKAAKEYLKAAAYESRRLAWHRHKRAHADSVDDPDDAALDEAPQDFVGHHGTGPFYTIARIPLLLFTVMVIFIELAAYIMVRQLVSIFEGLFRSNRNEYYQLAKASSYATWRRHARQLDVKEGKSSGSLSNVPTLKHHLRTLRRATRHLALESGVAEQGRTDIVPPIADDEETGSVSSAASATNLIDDPENENEHELLGVLRASATSLNELANEHPYAMNHTGTNLEMRQLVSTFLDALDEVDACSNPEVLHFKHWAVIKRKFASTNGRLRRESMAEMAERALGGLQARASQWTNPMRATLTRMRDAQSPTAESRSFLSRLQSNSEAPEESRLPAGALQGDEKASQVENGRSPRGRSRRGSGSARISAVSPKGASVSDAASKLKSPSRGTTGNSETYSEASPEHTGYPETEAGHLRSAFWESKRRFFSELAHTYGETALCLSGGAGNAFYHLGVVKTLVDRDMLPEYITGASGGYWGMFKNLISRGNIFDTEDWVPKLVKQVCGDLTFREAYERSHKALIIPVYNIDAKGKQHTRVLCYRTTPDVVIYSAVLASSALPRLLPPIELLRKDSRGQITPYHSFGRFWRDGSFQNELPFDALRQLFNVTFTVVSQVEPHISPFFYSHRGSAVYLRTGSRMTWPALGMLKDRLEIERRLAVLAEGLDDASPAPPQADAPEKSRK